MSKTLKKEGSSICVRKTRHTHSHSTTAVVTTESKLLDARLETYAPKRSFVSAHQVCSCFFQMKIFACGRSRQCIQMAWWQKKLTRSRAVTKSLLKKVWKLVQREISQTKQKLSRAVYSSVLCWCHQNRMTTGAQWTKKSKGSLFVTCHYSQTKFVWIFMQHTMLINCRNSTWQATAGSGLPGALPCWKNSLARKMSLSFLFLYQRFFNYSVSIFSSLSLSQPWVWSKSVGHTLRARWRNFGNSFDRQRWNHFEHGQLTWHGLLQQIIRMVRKSDSFFFFFFFGSGNGACANTS